MAPQSNSCTVCGELGDDDCIHCGEPVCSYCTEEHEYNCEFNDDEEEDEDDEGY